ncbi:serine/threonine-protein kinase [Streptomyces sp. NPDC050560]|uniref:serine/threonine-protein kinase n=1 Tax=Streptomyces sp. NPDC050560 TaxID=3365630 RepID=UPI00378BED47
MEKIGPYTVECRLGSGGMGTVYLARSRGGRQVAVKVARSELAEDAVFRERFRIEVEAARRVGGFHTAPVVDADPEASPPWLATAYIKGPTLTRLLEESGPMDEDGARMLGAALAEALSAIHACGIIHRDLKPGNILMADDGPRVVDFGIARAVEATALTVTGATFGTPGYLAPEQALGEHVGSSADVFALGAVLVTVLGGSAFGDGTPMALIYRSVHEEADLSRVPEGLRAAIEGCLEKRPSARPTPEELLDLFVPPRGAPTVVPGDHGPYLRGLFPRQPAPDHDRDPDPGGGRAPARDGARSAGAASGGGGGTEGGDPTGFGTGGPTTGVRGTGRSSFGIPADPGHAADGNSTDGPDSTDAIDSTEEPRDATPAPRNAHGGADPEATGGPAGTPEDAACAAQTAPAEFVAADADYAVEIDAEGFHAMVKDIELDFAWHEIRDVGHRVTGLGRRFELVVHFREDDVPYTCQLRGEPADTARWRSQLRRVLDVYLPGG